MGSEMCIRDRFTGITRAEQDRWAVRSQQRAVAAVKFGFVAQGITPITLLDGTVITAEHGAASVRSLTGHDLSCAALTA